jgi:hypothetical protein
MRLQLELVVSVTAIVLSQWVGQVWLASHMSKQQVVVDNTDIASELSEMHYQLQHLDALLAAKVVTVNPGANTLTVDQSMLQDTLRNIVADELNKVSPALSAEYSNTPIGTAYVGKTTYMGRKRPIRNRLRSCRRRSRLVSGMINIPLKWHLW